MYIKKIYRPYLFIREAMEKPLAEAQMAMEQSMAKYSLKDIADYIDKKIHF